jgi:NADH:ubiquinone oxidoreductase subunit H
VSIALLLLPVAACANSFNLIEIVQQQQSVWFVVPLLPVSIIFFISVLAETNRAPFDLPEAEAEIVAGYNVEYAGMTFAMFFLAEYSNMIIYCSCYMFFWRVTFPCRLFTCFHILTDGQIYGGLFCNNLSSCQLS